MKLKLFNFLIIIELNLYLFFNLLIFNNIIQNLINLNVNLLFVYTFNMHFQNADFI